MLCNPNARNNASLHKAHGIYFWLASLLQITEGRGVPSPPPQFPKSLQNRAKLNPIVKTVKNC